MSPRSRCGTAVSSETKPSQSKSSKIAASNSLRLRCRSWSSMRKRTRSAVCHTNSALTTCPRCRKPVGAGANRDIMAPMIQPNFRVAALISVSCGLILTTAAVSGQTKPKPGEWPTYGADLASTRYSPLDQITKDNFNKLEVAWRFETDALGPRPEFNFQGPPLRGDGVVYSTAGTP